MYHYKSNPTMNRNTGSRLTAGYVEPTLRETKIVNSDMKDFDVKKTFGISVLLKLTQKSVEGVKISESEGRYRSNLNSDEMNQAVNMTIKAHNIKIEVN